jgi:ribosome-associated toxin RatA of RatAB toxin-antitoxin module
MPVATDVSACTCFPAAGRRVPAEAILSGLPGADSRVWRAGLRTLVVNVLDRRAGSGRWCWMPGMGVLGGEASIEIEAGIEELWAIVEDVETAPEWQKGLEAMKVLERDADGRVVRAESVSDAKVKTVKSIVRFSYDKPNVVSWEQEKGDLKSVVGAWELEQLDDGFTRVTYRLEGDPGRVLGMMIRGPVEDRIREILVAGRPEELAARAGQA